MAELARRYIKERDHPNHRTLWSLQDNARNPEIVIGVHMDFINAGSKVLSLNNYAATPSRLERIGMRDCFDEIHSLSIQLLNTAISEVKVYEIRFIHRRLLTATYR